MIFAFRGLGIFPNKRDIFSDFPLVENLKNGGLLRNKPMLASLEKWQSHFSAFRRLADCPNAYGRIRPKMWFLWGGEFMRVRD